MQFNVQLQVQCLKGVENKAPQFESVTIWPKCNKKELPKCENFPEPPEGVPISLAERTPVLPGASVFYKCTGFGQVSNLGEEIEVRDNLQQLSGGSNGCTPIFMSI